MIHLKIKKFTIFLFALFLSLHIHISDSLRILGVFPLQMRSHFIMCDELMKGLAAKGHQVDIYSQYPSKKLIPNYQHFSLEEMLPVTSYNLTIEAAKEINGIKMFYGDFMKSIEATCNLMEKPIFQKLLHYPPKDPPYDLLITELTGMYCYLPLGRHLNVPVIGIVNTALCEWHYEQFGNPLNYAFNTCQYCPYASPMTFFERLNNFLAFKTIKYFFEQVTINRFDKIVKKIFGPYTPNQLDLIRNVSLILVNENTALNGVKPFIPTVVPIGGLHIVDRNETLPMVIQKWLDESDHGCIYFSFGSMIKIETFSEHILDVFYKAFKNIAPVRVIMKIVNPEKLPPGLPFNVLTQPWVNQIQILKHRNIKAFVTHGGLMGSHEAIYYGVPMVGIPIFGDQLSNIAGFVKKNIAVKVDVDEITEESLNRALNDVIYNKLLRKTVRRISEQYRDRPVSLLDTAIYWVEYIHKYGKYALRSPLIDMPWWQVYQFDIYGFLIVSIVTILYLLIMSLKILKCVCQKLCQKTDLELKKNK